MLSAAQCVEVHRLAVAGREAGIARDVGDRVARVWLARSRFADVVRLAELTLTLGEDPGAFYDLGWAKRVTGFPAEALAAFDRALGLYRNRHHRGNEAATLNNIGSAHDRMGNRQRALDYYGQALPILREVGNRAREAATRFNLAMVCRRQGDLDRAVAELEQVVELDRQVGHPDLESDMAMLEQIRQERT
ncbi:tetratricopeptide repeat protein [Actinoplanes sp. NPDC051411]|uniref:tetratricopeptide repeat protein n=1 Tax=Actinoplanes sp. NPDC051411 TaxID=3155522 RepID=UPI00341EB527